MITIKVPMNGVVSGIALVHGSHTISSVMHTDIQFKLFYNDNELLLWKLPSPLISQITTFDLRLPKFRAKCAPTPPPPPVINTT